MKHILLSLIILFGLSLGYTQQVKIGYVNTDRILAGSVEASEIARVYDLDRTGWMNQIKTMNDEIKQMERNFEIDKLTKNEAAKREAQARIDAKKAEAGQKLEEFFGDGGKAEQRYKELIEPLTMKINDVIKKISENERYTLILDVSMGTVLYALPSMDVTDQVLAELNKDKVQPDQDTLKEQTEQQKQTEINPLDEKKEIAPEPKK